jgi:leader peptidase (prepilin peptidase)/N-methyltransferase
VNVDQLGIPIAAVFGAMIGSFLNVLIVRLPKEESIVFPGSHCPRCRTPISWYDNVPVLSWLLLGGRCRNCRERISILYPVIEVVTATLWAATIWHYGVGLTGLTAVVFGTLLLGIAVTDARNYLIPDEYTLGGLGLGLLLSLRGGWAGLLQATIGAITGFVILYVVAVAGEKVFGKEAMGGGDIKMMAMVGAFVGWQGVLLTIFGGSLLGTIVFVPLSLKQKRLVPFGIFLAAAAALTFVIGDVLIAWYLDWVLGR